MTTTFAIRPATRQMVRPVIGLYGTSGTGKTYSALLLARGLAGPNGKLVLADSEAGRGSLYADVIPGGYDTLDLCEPFSPERYVEAMDTIEESGAAVGIIDSASHEWEGPGGVLDQAAKIEAEKGKGLHNWNKPKMAHSKWIQKLLRCRIPWIICIRAKHKSKQITNEKGKKEIVKDDFASPIQADDFIFESTCHMEILPDHSIKLTKISHPTLGECFPRQGPITIEHGQLLAKWCSAPGTSPAPTHKVTPELALLKKELWNMTADKHLGQQKALEQWLWDEALIDTDMRLADLTEPQLRAVIAKVKAYQPPMVAP